MAGETKFESAQQEIEILKKRIAELESPEAVKEAIKEHIEKPPAKILSEGYRLAPDEIKKQAERILGLQTEEEPHQRQVLELLQLVQEKGALNVISIVKQLNDPHLEDDFHAALIKYFQNV